eukprot:CAMPEP_0202365778 /NCGR_PEP_ID=MMETSP1126-20121109/16661_1 /ASSEMBLY_ACC=CAM_ASM_000457 /TAXON_ID=3047 /ORGANISM="Dunaliella tertiolecta, Strain CCMP1320" /LENGTH=68 /DNA_ID=CAMNT_0048960711 /DNA_START=92 /DNA_END=298 /DNA_ORIENTATION=-
MLRMHPHCPIAPLTVWPPMLDHGEADVVVLVHQRLAPILLTIMPHPAIARQLILLGSCMPHLSVHEGF